MAYAPQTWTDEPARTSALSAARFNYIESGLQAAAAAADAAQTTASAAETTSGAQAKADAAEQAAKDYADTQDAALTFTAADVGAIPTTDKGAASGVATLDGTGNVPADQLGNAASSTVIGAVVLGSSKAVTSGSTVGWGSTEGQVEYDSGGTGGNSDQWTAGGWSPDLQGAQNSCSFTIPASITGPLLVVAQVDFSGLSTATTGVVGAWLQWSGSGSATPQVIIPVGGNFGTHSVAFTMMLNHYTVGTNYALRCYQNSNASSVFAVGKLSVFRLGSFASVS